MHLVLRHACHDDQSELAVRVECVDAVVLEQDADVMLQKLLCVLDGVQRRTREGKRQTTPRMDRHETIVTGRCETFRYCHIGGKGMTSAKLKHRVKLQEWAARIQDCRSSGLSVRAWCRQEEINAATDYRWERELLALAETGPYSSVSAAVNSSRSQR